MAKKKIIAPNIVRGGAAIPLGDNIYLLKGRKHSQGGIDIGKDLEAEGDEVVKMNPKSIKVVTAQKIMGGKSPAELVVNASSTGEQEKVFNDVFKYQEKFKDRNNLNDDGTKKAKFGKEKKYVELTPNEAIAHNKMTSNNAFMYGVGTEDNPEFLYPEELEASVVTASLEESNKKKAEKEASKLRNRKLNSYIGDPNDLNLGDKSLQNIARNAIGVPLVIANPATITLSNGITSKKALSTYADVLAKTNHYLRPSTYLDKLYTRQLALPLDNKTKLLFDAATDAAISGVDAVKKYKKTKDKEQLTKDIIRTLAVSAIDPVVNIGSDLWQNLKYYKNNEYKKVLNRYLDKVYSNPNRRKILTNFGEYKEGIDIDFGTDNLRRNILGQYNANTKTIDLNGAELLMRYGYNKNILNAIARHEIHHAGVDQLPIFKRKVSSMNLFNTNTTYPNGYYARRSGVGELKHFDKNLGVNAWAASPEEFYAEENYLLEMFGKNDYKDLNKLQKRAYIEFLKDRFNLSKNEVMRTMVYGKKQGFALGGQTKTKVGIMKTFKDRKKANLGIAQLISDIGAPAAAGITQGINAGLKLPIDLGSVIGANIYNKKYLDKTKEATLDYNTAVYDAQNLYNTDKYNKLNELLDKYYKEDLADLEKHKIVRKDAIYNPVKLNTKINITEPLQEIARTRDRNIRSIIENSGSSKDALNRIRQEQLLARDKNVAVQSQKENIEKQLQNADITQRQKTYEKQIDANLRIDELRALDLEKYFNNLANIKKGYNQNKLSSELNYLQDKYNTENLKRTSDYNAENLYRTGRAENRMNLIQGISDSLGQFFGEVNNSAATIAKLQAMQSAYGNNKVNVTGRMGGKFKVKRRNK